VRCILIPFIAAISLAALEIAAEQCSEQERLAMTLSVTLQKPCAAPTAMPNTQMIHKGHKETRMLRLW